MSLIEYNLMGEKVDKVQTAINRLQAFEPEEGYYLAFSGGKDSVCIKALADMAGVKYDAHYNATTVDPPDLVRFIREHHPDVEIVKPDIPMRKLIVQKRMPPTRLVRYCCAHYKEKHGQDRVTLTGTRWAESSNRRNNQGVVTIFNGKAGVVAEENGANFTPQAKGGGGTQLRRFAQPPHSRAMLPHPQNPCESHYRLDGRGCVGVHRNQQPPVLQAVR